MEKLWRSSFLSVNFIVWLSLLGAAIQSSHAFPSQQNAQHSTSVRKRQTQAAQMSKHIPPEQHTDKQARVRTITVMCHPDFMEITVKADMFEVGTRINVEELRLGVDFGVSCRATTSSRDEYRIVAGLSDCGTKHWMTDESLIYTNLLIYSPMDSPDGLIRMDEAVIPVECHYERKYSLSSSSLMPTWIPFTSTLSAVETLDFKLRVMTSDWQYERGSKVFFIGEPINIEASVRVGHHTGFRVFVSSCVATLDPDSDSVPRYPFIEADGCLVDSQQQGSDAHFLPRTQDDKLQFTIDAFKFHEEEGAELYITCRLTALPVTSQADPLNKACTFINGRWRSADTSDYLCSFCPGQHGVNHVALPAGSKQTIAGGHSTVGPRGFGKTGVSDNFFRNRLTTNDVWEQEMGVGPMLVKEPRYRSKPLPLEDIPPLISQLSRPMYGSQWRSGTGFRTAPISLDEINDILESEEEDEDFQKGLIAEKERSLPVPTPVSGADVLSPEAPRLPGNDGDQDEDDQDEEDLEELEGDVGTSAEETKGTDGSNVAGPSDKAEVLTTVDPSTASPVSTDPEDHTEDEKVTSTTTAPATDSDKVDPKK